MPRNRIRFILLTDRNKYIKIYIYMGHPVLGLGVDCKENTSASRNAEGIR